MSFLTQSGLLLLMCLALTGQTRGWSYNVLSLRTLFNGRWDNRPEIQAGQDFVQLRIVPVLVPALSQEEVTFVQVVVKNKTDIMNLGVVSEGNNGIMYMTLYNFTEDTKYNADTYDLNDLAKLRPEDFQHEKDCVAAFELQSKDVLVASWPDCRHIVDGNHPIYSLTYTCDSHTAHMPLKTNLKHTLEPYKYTRIGRRFPLINAPPDYHSPCEKSDSENAGLERQN